MTTSGRRWKQRLNSYMKVLSLLEEAVRRHAENTMNELEEQGMIKRFEFTYELAWNVLRDYFEYQINAGISGPRDAFREAFHKNLIDDGDGWMEMIRSRNLSSHTYSEDIAKGLIDKIVNSYIHLFTALRERIKAIL